MTHLKFFMFIVYTAVVFTGGFYFATTMHGNFFCKGDDAPAVASPEKSETPTKFRPVNTRLHKPNNSLPTFTNDDINRDVIKHYRHAKKGESYTEKDLRKLRQKDGGNLTIKPEKTEKTEEKQNGVDKFFDTLRKEAGNLVEKAKELTQKPEFKDNPAIQQMMKKNPAELQDAIQNGVKRRNEALKQINSEME